MGNSADIAKLDFFGICNQHEFNFSNEYVKYVYMWQHVKACVRVHMLICSFATLAEIGPRQGEQINTQTLNIKILNVVFKYEKLFYV